MNAQIATGRSHAAERLLRDAIVDEQGRVGGVELALVIVILASIGGLVAMVVFLRGGDAAEPPTEPAAAGVVERSPVDLPPPLPPDHQGASCIILTSILAGETQSAVPSASRRGAS